MINQIKTHLSKYHFLFALLLMVLILHHPVLKSISESQLPFECPPDTYLVLTIIEWNMHAFLLNLPAIYHLNCFYPNAYITFYSHPLFGESLVFLFFNKMLGLNITNAYNFYLLFGFWIGAIGTFLLARELTRNRLAPFLASLIFILYPFARQSFTHLHVFSFFWVGFVFCYLIRFQKTNRITDAFWAGFFIFMQGLFSIYHTYFLLVIFIPLFYLFSILFRGLDVKKTIKLTIFILIFALLLVAVFSPFFTAIKQSGLVRDLDYGSLIDTDNIIRSISPFYQKFEFPRDRMLNLFPGFAVMFLVWMVLTVKTKKRILLLILSPLALLFVFFLNLNGYTLASNWIFFITLLSSLVYFLIRAEFFKPETKILMIMLFLIPLIFFKFSSLFPGSQFSLYGILTTFIPSLTNFRFLYRGVLLLIPVLATLASLGILEIAKINGKKRYFFLGLIIFFIMLENGYLKNSGSGYFRFEPSKYRKIEKNSDKIILELPIYDHRTTPILNNRYTINTMFHHNYYVNGRTAYRVHKNNSEVLNITLKNKNFPDENTMLWLLQNYSVDYIILNWKPRLLERKEDFLEKIKNLQYHCRILDQSPDFLVLRLGENYPVKEITRRYSYFHIKNRKLSLDFTQPYSGKLYLSVPEKNRRIEIEPVKNQSRIVLNFPDMKPNLKGTFIKIIFEKQAELKQVGLVK